MILNDLCEFIIDCEHKTAPTQETGYPSIRTPNIGRGNLILEDVNRVSEEVYQDWTKRGKPKGGDLIIAREAPVGNVAIIPEGLKVCLGQRTVLVRPNNDKVDSRYLCYYLLGNEAQGQILTKTSGATVAHLNMKDIRGLKISYLPNPSTQKKIASILSAYDDLIENNNQRIKLLEDMAEEIYKEWFVRLRFPGYNEAVFLDKDGKQVAPGTKGAIPDGWEKKSIKEIVHNKKEKYKEEEHFHLGIFDLSRMPRKSLLIPQFGDSGELESSRIIFKENDILFGSIRSYFHKVSSANKNGITNVSVLIFRPKKEIYRSYSLFTFFSNQFINWSINFSNGTKMPTISWNEVQNYSINKPTDDLLKSFEEIVFPMIKEIHVLSDKNIVLQETRDLLLPRLISGKLSVENLELETLHMAAEPQE
ncbi:restriction endonuclease subunit S [Mariniflexile aquimaris]|uniref:Restriction endonuclease subunit S n=1 Tax=Mariniflexile aquimaris TaxID=881009 RepID=A0ABW3BUQ3_9FLAO